MASRSSGGRAWSSRPWAVSRRRRAPVHRMFAATRSAIRGSSTSHPVSWAVRTPSTTPIEVQTSVSRCCASARSVMERNLLPARRITSATPPLIAAATSVTASPSPTFCKGCGSMSRSQAVTPIQAAAIKMSALSRPLEKYSALLWPKACSSSGGRAAYSNAHSAATAATRLTTDSAASENRPTDPVSRYAPSLRPMVITAAAIESTAYRRADPATVTPSFVTHASIPPKAPEQSSRIDPSTASTPSEQRGKLPYSAAPKYTPQPPPSPSLSRKDTSHIYNPLIHGYEATKCGVAPRCTESWSEAAYL